MCGIVGIVNLNPQEPVDEALLKRMRDVIRHRGPDGEGLWIEGPVGLGHRRLAIVDVDGGHQPMSTEGGSAWIVYNGEIYNHAALRQTLEARGYRYRTRSDTETILHLYEEVGDRCVEQLQGMFAFALWDRARGRLLLARDRLGIKPLYYAQTATELLFASEIKALLAARTLRPALNEAILPEYLATRFVSGEGTFFRDVRKLLPGRTLSWNPGEGCRERRYWRVPTELDDRPIGFVERAREVRGRLQDAVRSHLMSDVPLGLFLSGGIDSSGLAALMAPMLREPVLSFAVGFDEPDANELAYARLAAQAVGAEHREIVISPEQFFSILPRLIWHEDEPIAFPSSIPLFFVSQLARDHVKVVLTGEGADELFLGYNRYRVAAWNERLARVYQGLAPATLRAAIARGAARLPSHVRRYVGRSFLALPPDPRALLCENFAVFPEGLQRRLLSHPELVTAADPYASTLQHYEDGPGGVLERLSHADLHTYLVELLMKQDQMSMAASVESRVPFLDHRFVEYAAAMPAGCKLRGWQTKAVLRAALRDLVPRPILRRRKMGFPVPVGRWLQGRFWTLVEEFVLGPRALARGLFEPGAVRSLAEEHRRTGGHGDPLWLLVNLEQWQRIFLDGDELPPLVDVSHA